MPLLVISVQGSKCPRWTWLVVCFSWASISIWCCSWWWFLNVEVENEIQTWSFSKSAKSIWAWSPRNCFGTIVNLKCTSRLGLASLALTSMITETFKVVLDVMQMSSSKVQGLNPSPTTCLSQLASPPRSFKYDWFMAVTINIVQNLALSVLLFCPFMTWSFNTWTYFFKTWHPKFWNKKVRVHP
jgi:hypothetical protein